MAQFEAFSPHVEVIGQNIGAFLEGLSLIKSRALEILAANGIQQLKATEWYSQQAWLNAFRQIAQEVGSSTLFQIGTKIPDFAQFPSHINSIEAGLASIDVAYQQSHRGGDIGYYRPEILGTNSSNMICENPYPCDFDRGIVFAVARRYCSPGMALSVVHANSSVCRKHGARSCIYTVTYLGNRKNAR